MLFKKGNKLHYTKHNNIINRFEHVHVQQHYAIIL